MMLALKPLTTLADRGVMTKIKYATASLAVGLAIFASTISSAHADDPTSDQSADATVVIDQPDVDLGRPMLPISITTPPTQSPDSYIKG